MAIIEVSWSRWLLRQVVNATNEDCELQIHLLKRSFGGRFSRPFGVCHRLVYRHINILSLRGISIYYTVHFSSVISSDEVGT